MHLLGFYLTAEVDPICLTSVDMRDICRKTTHSKAAQSELSVLAHIIFVWRASLISWLHIELLMHNLYCLQALYRLKTCTRRPFTACVH